MKLTMKALLITLLCDSLVCGAALAQVQPSLSGPIHSRFGLPLSRLDAQPMGPANRQSQSSSSPPLSFTFGMIDFPKSVASFASGGNKAKHFVGGYGPGVLLNYPSDHGFLLKGTRFIKINYPGAAWTQPNAISDSDLIVGWYGGSYYEGHGFKLQGSTYKSFDYPGGYFTGAFGVNKLGDIVGGWYDTATSQYSHGFLLSGGVFTSIDVPGAAGTVAYGINSAGKIVGTYLDSSNNTHGFLLDSGTFTTVDYPGYSQNYVGDINDKGVIVGGYGDTVTINGVQYLWEHGYIYESAQFTNADAPFGPPAVTQTWHLSNNNLISGEYVDNSGTVYGYEAKVGP